MDPEALIELATKAPSSHNTQPWIFEAREGAILLYADRTRALPVNDPEDRELTISCGAALLNLRVAAAAAGWDARVTLLPEPKDTDLLARVHFEEDHRPSDEDRALAAAIDFRYTHRKRFEDREVPAELVSRLQAAAESEGARLHVVSDDETRDRLGDLVEKGDRAEFADPRWRRELAAWMHPRRRGDGLVVPIAPITRLVVRRFDVGARTGAKDEELAESSPLLAMLWTASDGVADWLSAGQALERALLVAAGEGVQASYLNQPCQVAELRPRLRELIGVPGLPQVVVRMGYPDREVRRAPRRPVEAVLEMA
jgi:nitroreductase